MNNLQLYNYQQEAVTAFKKNQRRGSFIFATGTGKTELAIGIIKEFLNDYPQGKVIFIVPRIVLVEQTSKRLASYGFESTMYYGMVKDLSGRTVVSTYQSLSRIEDLTHLINGWVEENNNVLLVFDEVHLASEEAENYVAIMKAASTFSMSQVSMLALTATIDEKDNKNTVILSACPILGKIAMGEAIQNGFLSKVKVIDSSISLTEANQSNYNYLTNRIQELISVLGTGDPQSVIGMLRSPRWQEAKEYLACVRQKNEILNFDPNKIKKVAEILAANPGKTLVFAERVDTLKMLAEYIKDEKVYRFIESKTAKGKRAQILTDFEAGQIQAIGTVHTLDIGFDQKDIANCIFLASNKNMNQLVQRLGRGVRLSNGKEVAQIFVVYAQKTSEQEVHRMIVRAVNEGKVEGITEEDKAIMRQAKKPMITFEWENNYLKAKGYTYPHKETLKRYNFRWNPDEKIWQVFCDSTEAVVIIKRMQGDNVFNIEHGVGALTWSVFK